MNIIFLNILPVVVVATIPIFVGYIWYSKMLFGKIWMKYSGDGADNGSMLNKIVVSYITYFLMAYVLAILLNYLVIASIIPAIILGTLVWLGFVVPTVASGYIWSSNKPAKLFLIQVSSFLISFILMSISLSYWI
ncbi:MAG: DUF1761 domain-containing protein [Candidatus Pacebacteria bacterium]|nr:DUF1761 domain-containing protein [Candidatus Paceibacterota bacterium]